MKYHLIDRKDYIIIKLSGDTRNNEALLVKRLLFPYFRKMGIIIIDLKQLKTFEPAILVGILNGIRKEVDFLKGELRLCSLKSEMDYYLKENRLDRIFQVYKDENAAIACRGRNRFEGK